MLRHLQTELLDSLPPEHPAARHNRRDLRLTNRLLGSHRWLARTLAAHVRPDELTLELGAGTGELGDHLARQGLAVDGLDLWSRPARWPADRQWHVGDLRAFAGFGPYRAVIGNLIFHQFSEEELQSLGRSIRRDTRLIVACEPERRRVSQVLYRTLAPLFGANHVSLHDAHVSIAAGFRGDELPRALGLTDEEWEITCSTSLLGIYRMLAIRRP